jgi:hypothetical protein
MKLQLGQTPLQFRNCSRSGLRPLNQPQIKPTQLGHRFYVADRVLDKHPGSGEIQICKIPATSQMSKSCSGYVSVAEMNTPKHPQPPEINKTGVGDLTILKIEVA